MKLLLNKNNKHMKAKRIVYSRLVSKGNYENAKIEIELEVEEYDNPNKVFAKAKEWVDNKVELETMSNDMYNKCKRVLDDRRNYTIAQVEEAELYVKKYREPDELPF